MKRILFLVLTCMGFMISASQTLAVSMYTGHHLGVSSNYNSEENYANGINNNGQVVGTSSIAHAYITNGNIVNIQGGTGLTISDLGTLGGTNSNAYGINNIGQVVGTSMIAKDSYRRHAFIYEIGNGMTDLGTLGGRDAYAYDINESSQVVGSSLISDSSGWHAFIYGADNGMTDLGTLGGTNSIAHGINDAGQVVGRSQISGDDAYHAFLWDPVEGMFDLNDLMDPSSPYSWNYVYEKALDINNLGQIIAYCGLSGGGYSFRLEPVGAPVPVPTTMFLLGSGFLGLAAFRRTFRIK